MMIDFKMKVIRPGIKVPSFGVALRRSHEHRDAGKAGLVGLACAFCNGHWYSISLWVWANFTLRGPKKNSGEAQILHVMVRAKALARNDVMGRSIRSNSWGPGGRSSTGQRSASPSVSQNSRQPQRQQKQ